MFRSHHPGLIPSVAVVLCCAVWGPPALAQEAAEEASLMEEILVTAQKREESLIEVPLSLSVVQGETVNNFKVVAFDDLDRWVPNFWVNDSPGNNTVYIRGIGTTPGNLAFEQSVTLFVDGVYAGRARQFQAPFVDIERIEVLRGPQGALVGTNTSAGAVLVTTARPTEEFGAHIGASYEFEQESWEVNGYITGRMTENVQGRFAMRYRDTGGYLYNTATGRDEPRSEDVVVRGSLAWQPGDNWDILGKIELTRFDTAGSPFQRVSLPDYPFDFVKESIGFGTADSDKNKARNATLTINYAWGDSTITSITAYSEYDFTKLINADQFTTDTWLTTFAEDFSQWSQELRLTSPADQTVSYIAGVYYHHNEVDPLYAQTRVIFPTTAGPLNGTHDVNFYQDTDMFSAFASVTWNITDAVALTGELRYTDESKDAIQDRAITSGFLPPTWAAQTITDSRSDTSTDPGLKLTWQATDSLMVYGSYAEGSKSGGWQGNARDLTADNWQIDGESSESYEAGFKATLFDGNAWLSFALYDTSYEKLQVSIWNGTSFSTANAGEATTKGAEVEGAWQIGSAWSLAGGLAYLDAKYDDFPGAPCRYDEPGCDPATNNLAGERLGWAPEWSGNLRLSLDQDMGSSLRLFGTLALLYRDDVWLSPSGAAGAPTTLQPSTTWVDARIGIGSRERRWDVALVAKNLTDEFTISQNYVFPFPVNVPSAPGATQYLLDPPRTIYLEANLYW